MVDFRKWASAFVALLLFAGSAQAQNRTTFAGERVAFDYAYGVNQSVAPLTVGPNGGTTASGTGTLTVNFGFTTAADGTTSFSPLNVNAPVTVDDGPNQETVTPTAVNCQTPTIYQSCSFTASFSFAHGTGTQITTGTVGLQEALNSMASNGGSVALTAAWAQYGGTNAIISAAAPYSTVFIIDNRGRTGLPTGASTYWTAQPNTLTDLATPSTLTSSNVVFTSATGTWGTSAYYFCLSYVDILGGEGPCSASYTQTPGTTAYTLTVTSPAASTGAVGWRMYAGITSTALAYLLPITSSSCTLTTLEQVVPACAIGAAGTWPAIYLNTTTLSPVALGVTNTNNPVPQGHTTFSYQPTGQNPYPFQTSYGPFGTGTIASATASEITPLGTFELPAGYLNQIGRTVRVTGKISLTAGASSTLGIFVENTWPGGGTGGQGSAVCNTVSGFVFPTAASVIDFLCTFTTNAVGSTAVGSLMPESWFLGNTAAGTGTTSPAGVEKSAAAVGSLGLFAQDQFTVYITPLVAADTLVQLQSLHIETLL